jgi:UDP-N-acetylglucosamine--N-acetylmuramyl-(pentapeptide) pyrophosphoryl-undecaprenol N-acetylglucosamine transferase
VADSLRSHGAAVEFVGSANGIEARLVPQAGYKLHALTLAGLAGGPAARARAGALFLKAITRCRNILKTFRPGAVLGVGGYASAPTVVAAKLLKIPTYLHEQNSIPGRANRLASRFTREVLVTFPAAVGLLKGSVHVGMPTRREFFGALREEGLARLGLVPPVVLLFGGSGGALKLNLTAQEAFGGGETPYSVYQISGRRDFERLSTKNPRHRIVAYDDELWHALAASEVVLTRSGAGSLFDTAAVGRAAILVPYPYATADHQLLNARYFTSKGAAELLLDHEVTVNSLREHVERLLEDRARRESLSKNIRTLATPEAAGEVAGRLLLAAAAKGAA